MPSAQLFPYSAELACAFDLVLKASGAEEAVSKLVGVAKRVGFDKAMASTRSMHTGWSHWTTWDKTFVNTHFSAGNWTSNPVMMYLVKMQQAFWWSSLPKTRKKIDIAFCDSAIDAGIVTAVTVPFYDAFGLVSVFHFSSSFKIPETREVMVFLTALASIFQLFVETTGRKIQVETGSDDPLLSTREVQVLTRAANGANNKLIADELRISENAVEYHFRNILMKLGVSNRVSAVVTAIKKGLIVP